MTAVAEQVAFKPDHVRNVMSAVPTSVTVVSGQPELTGERAAMIVGSFVFISFEPCLVGFFVKHGSSTWPQLNRATVLGISTLGCDQASFCRKLGKKDADRFDGQFWRQGDLGAPLVDGAVASLECQIENVAPVGDHDFVVTRVLSLNTGNVTNPLIFQNHGFTGVLPIDATAATT